MANTDNWNSFYTNIMPLLGVCVSTLGVAIALLALQRSQSQAAEISGLEPTPVSYGLAVAVPKVRYQDGQAIMLVRNPGEWHNIRDFVQPDNPVVMRMARMIAYG